LNSLDNVEKSTNPYAKQLLVTGVFVVLFAMPVFYTSFLKEIYAVIAVLLPIFLVYWIVLTLLIYRKGISPLPLTTFLIGFVFIAGGAAFDGLTTINLSPDLANESNPIVRSLLDSGYPIAFVTVYAAFSQIALIVLFCLFWAAFLRHQDTFIALAKAKNPKTRLAFIKAAMGGAHLSWRQFLVPMRPDEFPTSYYLVWALSSFVLWGSFYRWYLGFNWLGIITIPIILVSIFILIIMFASYCIWLLYKFDN
jgi:hypothetical protein